MWYSLLKNTIGLGLCLGLFVACGQKKNPKQLLIHNPSNVERTELATLPYADFLANFPVQGPFKLVDPKGKEIPYQLEKKGTDSVQNLLLWVDVPAKSDLALMVEEGEPQEIPAKTFARYVPERLDDFAWENDKVAFRMYGKALEGQQGDGHGTDIWTKNTDKLVIDERYSQNDYHKDHGDGLDYYEVGMTLGAGDIAPFVGNKIIYPKHYRQYEVLDNGPLRSTFKLTYEPWNVDGQQVSVSKTISIDAGSQLNRVEVVYHLEKGAKLPIAAGIVLRKEEGKILSYPEEGITAYWEPQHGADGTLGIAVLSTSPIDQVKEVDRQLLTQYTVASDQAFVYYNGGAWDKAGAIRSADEWAAYLRQFKTKLTQPLAVSIK